MQGTQPSAPVRSVNTLPPLPGRATGESGGLIPRECRSRSEWRRRQRSRHRSFQHLKRFSYLELYFRVAMGQGYELDFLSEEQNKTRFTWPSAGRRWHHKDSDCRLWLQVTQLLIPPATGLSLCLTLSLQSSEVCAPLMKIMSLHAAISPLHYPPVLRPPR